MTTTEDQLEVVPVPVIEEVWKGNLEEAFKKIREIVLEYPIIAMDTEFPGIVEKPLSSEFDCFWDFTYGMVVLNVNALKIIQLGISFFNEDGKNPTPICSWQFNFSFDLSQERYAQESIDLLVNSGIQFDRLKTEGIDRNEFAELLMTSGLVLCDEVKWISYHRSYDFGYMLKLLTSLPIPDKLIDFFEIIRIFFPYLYDVKYIMKNCLYIPGGLQSIADCFKISRIGVQHQAGSDSLLTGMIFFHIKKIFLSNFIDDVKFNGHIYDIKSISTSDQPTASIDNSPVVAGAMEGQGPNLGPPAPMGNDSILNDKRNTLTNDNINNNNISSSEVNVNDNFNNIGQNVEENNNNNNNDNNSMNDFIQPSNINNDINNEGACYIQMLNSNNNNNIFNDNNNYQPMFNINNNVQYNINNNYQQQSFSNTINKNKMNSSYTNTPHHNNIQISQQPYIINSNNFIIQQKQFINNNNTVYYPYNNDFNHSYNNLYNFQQLPTFNNNNSFNTQQQQQFGECYINKSPYDNRCALSGNISNRFKNSNNNFSRSFEFNNTVFIPNNKNNSGNHSNDRLSNSFNGYFMQQQQHHPNNNIIRPQNFNSYYPMQTLNNNNNNIAGNYRPFYPNNLSNDNITSNYYDNNYNKFSNISNNNISTFSINNKNSINTSKNNNRNINNNNNNYNNNNDKNNFINNNSNNNAIITAPDNNNNPTITTTNIQSYQPLPSSIDKDMDSLIDNFEFLSSEPLADRINFMDVASGIGTPTTRTSTPLAQTGTPFARSSTPFAQNSTPASKTSTPAAKTKNSDFVPFSDSPVTGSQDLASIDHIPPVSSNLNPECEVFTPVSSSNSSRKTAVVTTNLNPNSRVFTPANKSFKSAPSSQNLSYSARSAQIKKATVSINRTETNSSSRCLQISFSNSNAANLTNVTNLNTSSTAGFTNSPYNSQPISTFNRTVTRDRLQNSRIQPVMANTSAFPAMANASAFPVLGNTSAFPAMANRNTCPAIANTSAFPAMANASAFPAIANTSAFPAMANTSAFPAMANASAFQAMANTSAFPAMANTSAFSALANTSAFPAMVNTSAYASEFPALTSAFPVLTNTSSFPARADASAFPFTIASNFASSVVAQQYWTNNNNYYSNINNFPPKTTT